jgi:deoxyribodipyrimidine photolyase-related protein
VAPTVAGVRTVWVFGDQLGRHVGPLAAGTPGDTVVLMVESTAKLASKRWHVQRAHLVVAGMRRFAIDLRTAGFRVDYRQAPSLAAGLAAHRAAYAPHEVEAMVPASWEGRALVERLGVVARPNEQFLCSPETFASWAASRRRLKMEDFYRWQRRRLGYLMDGDKPAGGRWNFDHDNREPPPAGPAAWPEVPLAALDDLDRQVLADLRPYSLWGAEPSGVWATTRTDALRRLDHVIEHVALRFGPHEDAMLSTSWHLAHTLLSPYLNLGMLHPADVCDRVEEAFRAGQVPIASAEGLIRQVIGWREYVWGLYWLWMPEYREANALTAARDLPPLFTGAPTNMRCVQHTLGAIEHYGWTHHIQRLMIIGNLCLLAGVRPDQLVEWMWASFVDGAEWVMVPNVIGMALHADGGRMATKPYAGGGAYIDRMSDYCGACPFDRTRRTGPNACPFTTLYWDFLDRHRERFARNPRMVQQVRGLDRLGDLDDVRARAREVLVALERGEL